MSTAGEVSVEQTFDPAAVEVIGCSGAAVTVDPTDVISVTAVVGNQNDQSALCDVVFAADDLANQPILTRINGALILSGGSRIFDDFRIADITDNDLPDRVPFTTVVDASVVPGSVVPVESGEAPASVTATGPVRSSGCSGCPPRQRTYREVVNL